MSVHSVPFGLIVYDEASPAIRRAAIAAAAALGCRWLSHWDDAVMPCRDRAIPGGALCAEHLIDNERTKP